MRISDVKFKSRLTEGSSNIEPTLTLIGSESIEAIEHTVGSHDKLVEALSAAMDYIKKCPCDPDIYPEQLEAWNKLQSLNVEKLLGE